MPAARHDLALYVRGLGELRRTLRKLDRGTDFQVRGAIKQIADAVRDRARDNAPRRSGRLERSIRSSVTTKGAAIRSNLEYAPVQEWGGTTGRGHSRHTIGAIRVKGSHFMQKGVDESRVETERELEQLLDHIENQFVS